MSGLCDIACKMDFSFKSELLLARAIFVRTNGSSGNSPTKKHTHTSGVFNILNRHLNFESNKHSSM